MQYQQSWDWDTMVSPVLSWAIQGNSVSKQIKTQIKQINHNNHKKTKIPSKDSKQIIKIMQK